LLEFATLELLLDALLPLFAVAELELVANPVLEFKMISTI